MLKVVPIFWIIFNLTIPTCLADSIDVQDQFYVELLQKHEQQGHLNGPELKNYQFNYTKNKAWQEKFNNQVRGVASSLKIPREKIYLTNPAIEISVK